MKARDAIASAIKGNEWQNRWELTSTIIAQLYAAGFTIMSKEDVEAVRGSLERSIVAIDDWLHQYASDMCSEEHVKETGRRIAENGGTLAYIADVQERNRAAIRSLKSGGRE